MDTYKTFYNDGVYAETLYFDESVTEGQKQDCIQKEIEEYNKNPNPNYHITKANFIKQ